MDQSDSFKILLLQTNLWPLKITQHCLNPWCFTRPLLWTRTQLHRPAPTPQLWPYAFGSVSPTKWTKKNCVSWNLGSQLLRAELSLRVDNAAGEKLDGSLGHTRTAGLERLHGRIVKHLQRVYMRQFFFVSSLILFHSWFDRFPALAAEQPRHLPTEKVRVKRMSWDHLSKLNCCMKSQ